MNWIILAITSSFFSAMTTVLEKLMLKGKDTDPVAFSFVFQMLVAILFFAYTIVTKSWEYPPLQSVYINIILMTLLYGLGSIFIFCAYKESEASEVSIIFSTSAVWSTLVAVWFLGDKLSDKNIVGMVLVVLGLILVNIKKTRWQIGRGHLYGLLSAIMFGGAFVNDAYILGLYKSIPAYMVIAFAFPSFVSILVKPTAIRSIPIFLELKTALKLLLCSTLYALAALTVFSAIKFGGQPSTVNMLRQSGLVFTVVLSYFILLEKDNMRNKWVAVLLAIIGGVLLI